MSRFESIEVQGQIPPIDTSVVAIDFTLVHGEGSAAGVEKFTFMPKVDNPGITTEVLPEAVRNHPDVQDILFGVLVGRGSVDSYTGLFPHIASHIESVNMVQNGHSHHYEYKLKRAKAEFGVGNSQPGYLVIGSGGMSFYPKETHARAIESTVSGVVLALGGVYAVIRRKRTHQ